MEATVTRAQANEIIKTNMLPPLADEVDFIVNEEWETWKPDYVGAMEHYDGSDFYTGAFKKEHTRLLKLIGLLRQVKEGEEIVIFKNGKTRELKTGQWYAAHAYSQFKEA